MSSVVSETQEMTLRNRFLLAIFLTASSYAFYAMLSAVIYQTVLVDVATGRWGLLLALGSLAACVGAITGTLAAGIKQLALPLVVLGLPAALITYALAGVVAATVVIACLGLNATKGYFVRQMLDRDADAPDRRRTQETILVFVYTLEALLVVGAPALHNWSS